MEIAHSGSSAGSLPSTLSTVTLIIFGLSVSSRARSRAAIILVTKKPTDPRMKPRVIFSFPRFSALF